MCMLGLHISASLRRQEASSILIPDASDCSDCPSMGGAALVQSAAVVVPIPSSLEPVLPGGLGFLHWWRPCVLVLLFFFFFTILLFRFQSPQVVLVLVEWHSMFCHQSIQVLLREIPIDSILVTKHCFSVHILFISLSFSYTDLYCSSCGWFVVPSCL